MHTHYVHQQEEPNTRYRTGIQIAASTSRDSSYNEGQVTATITGLDDLK